MQIPNLKKTDIEIRKIKWDNLRISQQGGVCIQINSHYPKNLKKSWYVCKGITQFKGPSHQSKAAILGNVSYCESRLSTGTDATLNSKLKYVYIIHRSKYVDTSTDINLLITNNLPESNVNSRETIVINTENISVNDKSPPKPPPTPPLLTKYEIVQKRVRSALKLDLSILLRLSRSTPHISIAIHNRKQTQSLDHLMVLFTEK